jgi:hypothetical protein
MDSVTTGFQSILSDLGWNELEQFFFGEDKLSDATIQTNCNDRKDEYGWFGQIRRLAQVNADFGEKFGLILGSTLAARHLSPPGLQYGKA